MIEVTEIDSFPPGNPFHHDAIRMGMEIGSNVTVMFHQHLRERQETIIVCNTETGERVHINFGPGE